MRIGPIHINLAKKNAAGLKVYPWQALTEDRVTPELRQVVAKIARSEAKNYLQARSEDSAVSADAGKCDGSHVCIRGKRVPWCFGSCTACLGTDFTRTCFAVHGEARP